MVLDPMDYIWSKLPKSRAADGEAYIEYTITDLPYLYHNGFVDTQAYSLDDWLIAFIPFKQDNGSYRLNKEQFLNLRHYRYAGMIRAPFDPLRIREGEWTEEDLWKLYHLSIKPSSTLSEEQYGTMIATAKKKGRFVEGKFRLDRSFKTRLKQLVEQNPSPLRRLELRVAGERKKEETRTTQKEKSKFSVGKTKAESTQKAFSELLTKR